MKERVLGISVLTVSIYFGTVRLQRGKDEEG